MPLKRWLRAATTLTLLAGFSSCFWWAEDETDIRLNASVAQRAFPDLPLGTGKLLTRPEIRRIPRRIEFKTTLLQDLANKYHATVSTYEAFLRGCPESNNFTLRLWSSHLLYNAQYYLHSSRAFDEYLNLAVPALGLAPLSEEAEEQLAQTLWQILAVLQENWRLDPELARQRFIDWLVLEGWFQCGYRIGSPCLATKEIEESGPALEFVANGSTGVLCAIGRGAMGGRGSPSGGGGVCKSVSSLPGGSMVGFVDPIADKNARFRCSMLQLADSNLLRECVGTDPVSSLKEQGEAMVDSKDDTKGKEKDLLDEANRQAGKKGKSPLSDQEAAEVTGAALDQYVIWTKSEADSKAICEKRAGAGAVACNIHDYEGHEGAWISVVNDYTYLMIEQNSLDAGRNDNRFYLNHERAHGWFREYERKAGIPASTLFGSMQAEHDWIHQNVDQKSRWNRDCAGPDCAQRCAARMRLPSLTACFEAGYFGSAADIYFWGVTNCRITQCGITDPPDQNESWGADSGGVPSRCMVATPAEPGGACGGFTSQCIGGMPMLKHLWVVDPAPYDRGAGAMRVFVPWEDPTRSPLNQPAVRP